MNGLIFADGTELKDSYVMLDDGILWFYVQKQMDIRDVFALFSDRAKTARIVDASDVPAEEFDGYTEIFCIRQDNSNQISGGLKKGAAA